MAGYLVKRLAVVKGATVLCTCSLANIALGGYAFVAEGIPLPLVPLFKPNTGEKLWETKALTKLRLAFFLGAANGRFFLMLEYGGCGNCRLFSRK